jgi:hypothetical protein
MECEWDKHVTSQSTPRPIRIVLSSVEIFVNMSKICFTKFQILYQFFSDILVFLHYTLFKRSAKGNSRKKFVEKKNFPVDKMLATEKKIE